MSTLRHLLALPFALALACDSNEGEDEHSHSHDTGDEHQSDCEAETRDDEFSIGLSKSSESVTVTFVAADPAPPVNGDNTWTVALTDAGGQPLVDASITSVLPWMPDHGHGTAVEAKATATENPGEFVITPIDFHMNGLWEVTLDIQVQPDTTEQVVFAFCVE